MNATACICAGVLPWKNYSGSAVTSATRVYYISAEEVKWTYTPGGEDLVYGPLLETYVQFSAAPGTLHANHHASCAMGWGPYAGFLMPR